LQPVTEEEEFSSTSSEASTATTVLVEEAFPAGATALPGSGANPFLGDPALLALSDQVTRCVMINYMPLSLRPLGGGLVTIRFN
jgi:hypothetical protein